MKTAVVVVHGVGDPQPGDALSGLVQGLASRGWQEVDARLITQEIEDNDDDAHLVAGFPVHQARLGHVDPQHGAGQHELLLNEVYWGDVSRVRGGTMAVVSAAADLVLGLRHFVRAAVEDARRQAAQAPTSLQRALDLLRCLTKGVFYLVRGPLFASNLIGAATAVVYVLLNSVEASPSSSASSSTDGMVWAAFWAALTLILLGTLLRNRIKDRHWSPITVDWLLGLSALLIVALAVLAYLRDGQGLSFDNLVQGGTWVVSAVTFVIIGALLLLVMLCVTLPLASAQGEPRQRLRRSLDAALFCSLLFLALFTYLAIIGWLGLRTLLLQLAPPAGVKAASLVAERIDCGVHLFPVHSGILVLTAMAFLLLHLVNHRRGGGTRYIVNTAILWLFVALATAAAGVLGVVAYWLEVRETCSLDAVLASALPASIRPIVQTVHDFEQYKGLVTAIVMAVVTLVLSSPGHLRPALDFVLDVQAHFRWDGSSDEAGRRGFGSWSRIVQRFRQVLDRVHELPGVERVIVLAHSQGTIVALQGLGVLKVEDGETPPPAHQGGKPLHLITMGSPLDHLYRHYFPARYRLDGASERVSRWTNIHRSDDFIGRGIRADATTGMPDDRPIGRGGHTDYWRDHRVLDILMEHLGRHP